MSSDQGSSSRGTVCCVRGCGFAHRSITQLRLHEAMAWHCASCGRSDLETDLTNINMHQLCDTCTVTLEWARPTGKDEDTWH